MLKPLRNHHYDAIDKFMTDTAERGCVVIYDSSVSGLGGMDDANALVKLPTSTAGNPAGVLMNDVVNIDQSRYSLNLHQDEVQSGGKVALLRKGFVVTNSLVAGQNPVPGSGAYFNTSGQFTMVTTSTRVGTFDSAKDADGYVKVEIQL